MLGTLDYIAPELIEGKEATPLSDVYALGCLVYECVTGSDAVLRARDARGRSRAFRRTCRDPREKRDAISEELAWALLQALEKDPERRPPSARSFGRMLKAAAGAR